jgi:hypothetical protein
MRTVSRSKNNRHDPKKEIIMHNRKTDFTGIADIAGIESDKLSENAAAGNSTMTGVSNEERHQLISEAAYYRAEQRSFEPGHELEDWLTAETDVERKLSSFAVENLRKHT